MYVMKFVIHKGILSSLCLALLISACSSAEEKIPTVEVNIANKAFELSRRIKDAFIAGDQGMLKEYCTPDLFRILSPRVGTFKDLSLEFSMKWVDIHEDDTIHLYVSWKRNRWKGEALREDSGMAVFVIQQNPFLAAEILRGNPFLE